MSDNIAVLDGFTIGYLASCNGGYSSTYILVKPDTDLDNRFKAWDCDNQEFVYINGWLGTFAKVG